MDLYSTLPTEILLVILKGLPDLFSTVSICLASPRIFHVFATYGVEILESRPPQLFLPPNCSHYYYCWSFLPLLDAANQYHVTVGTVVDRVVALTSARAGVRMASMPLARPPRHFDLVMVDLPRFDFEEYRPALQYPGGGGQEGHQYLSEGEQEGHRYLGESEQEEHHDPNWDDQPPPAYSA